MGRQRKPLALSLSKGKQGRFFDRLLGYLAVSGSNR